MNRKTRIFSQFVLLVFLTLSWGCKSCKPTKETQEDTEDKTVINEFRELNKRVNEIYYRFPTPDEMFTFVNDEGLEFDPDLLNPVENAKNYIDSKSQTLNLGIYVADLGYITLFQKYKESVSYFDIIHNLSEEIRIAPAFGRKLLNRIENNLKNVDSLKAISNDSYANMINYLVENDKEKTFAMISIGAYVEFLYITLNLVGEYSDDSPTIQRIAEQKYAFENLYFYFEEFKGEPMVDGIFDDVKKLKNTIDKISETTMETTVEKEEDGKLILGGGNKINITEEQFYELKKISTQLRNKFVAG